MCMDFSISKMIYKSRSFVHKLRGGGYGLRSKVEISLYNSFPQNLLPLPIVHVLYYLLGLRLLELKGTYSQPHLGGSFHFPPGGLHALSHNTFWTILLLSLQTSLSALVLLCYLLLILAVALNYALASLVAQWLKCLPPMWETRVQSLGQEDPLEKEMVTHSSILAWRIPWTEEPGGLQSVGLQRVGHD